MKLIGTILLIVVIALGGLFLARNAVVKAGVEQGVEAVTGMPLAVGKLDLDFNRTLVDIEGLTVKNPKGFHGTALVEVPKILVDYNLSNILKGKIHLENVEFDMKQFNVVKNEEGQLNLDSLKALQQKGTPGQPSKPAPQEKGKAVPLQIDNLRLRIGKVSFVDYSSGIPSVKDFSVNIDQTFKNITDPQALVKLIVAKALMNTTIANLTNFDLGTLESGVSGILSSGSDMATAAAAKGLETLTTSAGGLAGGATGQVKDAAESVTGEVKDAAKALTDKLKISF